MPKYSHPSSSEECKNIEKNLAAVAVKYRPNDDIDDSYIMHQIQDLLPHKNWSY